MKASIKDMASAVSPSSVASPEFAPTANASPNTNEVRHKMSKWTQKRVLSTQRSEISSPAQMQNWAFEAPRYRLSRVDRPLQYMRDQVDSASNNADVERMVYG